MDKSNQPLRILIIDNNREENSFGSKELVDWTIKTAPSGSEVIVRRAPELDLPPIGHPLDAMVISGSVTSCLEYQESWIGPYDDFITTHIQKATPMLGVCYGHQTIARCLERIHGNEPKLRKSENAELGWEKVQVIDDVELLKGLEEGFYVYHSHYEEVSEVPPGSKIFAQTERCNVQGFQVQHKPIFGIQFHPEYSAQEGEESIARKIKRGERADWILNAGKGHELYSDKVGKAIFGNFFRIANSQR